MSKRTPTRRSRKPSPPRRHAAGNNLLRLTTAQSSPAALKRNFESALKRGRPIDVDAKAGGRLSAAQIQVVVSAALSAQTRGLPFRIVAPSDAVANSFADLGLYEWLQDNRTEPTAPG